MHNIFSFIDSSPETKDEPYAWESREFLRKKVIGKEVMFSIDPKSKALNREYGCLYLGKGNIVSSFLLHAVLIVFVLCNCLYLARSV